MPLGRYSLKLCKVDWLAIINSSAENLRQMMKLEHGRLSLLTLTDFELARPLNLAAMSDLRSGI